MKTYTTLFLTAGLASWLVAAGAQETDKKPVVDPAPVPTPANPTPGGADKPATPATPAAPESHPNPHGDKVRWHEDVPEWSEARCSATVASWGDMERSTSAGGGSGPRCLRCRGW